MVLSTHARRLFCVLGSAHSLMKGGELPMELVIELVKLLTSLVGLAAAIAGAVPARRRNVPYKQAKSRKRKR